ncbi:hypothetical protein PNI0164_01833 [Streptococcus pneumoniae PNI0164]|nr:hypothetical protein PNI0164_01833 [Streptococcus pneumoniae PNI0164]
MLSSGLSVGVNTFQKSLQTTSASPYRSTVTDFVSFITTYHVLS